MATCKLLFWNDGKPFEPLVYPEDVAKYVEDETKLLAPVHAARADLREAEAIVQDLIDSKAKKIDIAKAQRARDKAHAALLAADQAAKDPLHVLQAGFITATLKRCTPPLEKTIRLTVPQIRGGFQAVWDAAHDWRTDAPEARPLADTGGTSASSPSPA